MNKPIAVAAILIAGLGGATIGSLTEHHDDTPPWATHQCSNDYDVNCVGVAEGHKAYILELPGDAHMVCVYFADKQYQNLNYCD